MRRCHLIPLLSGVKFFVRAAIKLFLYVLKQIYGRSQSLSESHLPLTGKIRYVNHLEIGTNVDNKTDPIHILQGFGLNEKMTVMIKSQLENMNKNPHGRRWDQDIIRMCLTLYCRSPKNYEYLSKAGYLILPSAQQIQRYKNKVQQNTGINKEVLEWMKSEAVFRELPKRVMTEAFLLMKCPSKRISVLKELETNLS